MFAATPARSSLAAYRQVGTGTSIESASPHRLVAMLYEGLSERIQTARGALARRDIPAKAHAIGSAVRIVEEGLSAPLNLRDGGEIAARLASLYDYLVRRLTHANLRNDDAALAECAALVRTLREGWDGIAP